MVWKAVSTLVESKAEVSRKDRPFFSANIGNIHAVERVCKETKLYWLYTLPVMHQATSKTLLWV